MKNILTLFIKNKTHIFAFITVSLIMLLSCSEVDMGEDWVTYRHDNRRSGVTSESLNVKKLHELWSYTSPGPPQPAWAGPAKWDAYAKVTALRSMRNYDMVFHVIVVGNYLYFGSSVEDAVLCLDTGNGKERWAYITDGPVRIVPAFADGNIYFGSDDGYAYCVDAHIGLLIWKYKPSPEKPLIPNNGKFISQWPIRTGVLVEQGRAIFGASLLPWKESYLCALDLKFGSPEAPGCYTVTLENKTLEGALLASSGRLFATQGRIPPAVFDSSSGNLLGELTGGGGVFAIITPESRVLHGPGNKTGWITESDQEEFGKIAHYPLGNAIIAVGDMYYVLTDTWLTAIYRTTKEKMWKTECGYPFSLILAGNTLFAGGDREVAAFNALNGEIVWSANVDGKAYGLATAHGKLFVSTDTGSIYCFGI